MEADYFVGPSAKEAWATFADASEVRDWIADNAKWERTIGDETLEEARYRGKLVRVFKRTLKHSGSGELMHGAWVPDHTISTVRGRRIPPYDVETPDGETLAVAAPNARSAIQAAVEQTSVEGVYTTRGVSLRAVRHAGGGGWVLTKP